MANISAGLSETQVRQRIQQGKTNQSSRKPSRTFGEIFYANIVTRFNAILGSLVVVILIVGSLQDALFGLVLIGNTLIGIIQEVRAKLTLDKLSLLNASRARVIREGISKEIPIEAVVLDDMISLYPGDQVVADGIVEESYHLEVDESLLTGESLPIAKYKGDKLLSGSFIISGNGIIQATNVGDTSYAQALATQARTFALVHSELMEGINRMLGYIIWAIPVVAFLLFFRQLQAHPDITGALLSTVAALVAMVPEGLVLLTSIAFAVSIVTLGRYGVLVRELPAVEGLARIDVICFDKTGTLTDGTLSFDRLDIVKDHPHIYDALRTLSASSFPSPLLSALGNAFPAHKKYKPLDTIPFSPLRKWSSVSIADEEHWIMGAPDILIDASHTLSKRVTELAKQGQRILLLAHSKKKPRKDALPSPLTPHAFIIFAEHLRPDAKETLAYFHKEHVQVNIISGDNPYTVQTIAIKSGLTTYDAPFDGRQLPSNAMDLARVMENQHIFGRVTPQQKQAMVAALQASGHIVAMVGDGVNDVLALKQADIAITMRNGVEASKAVSQFVLLDAHFSTLPEIVAQGRRIIANIERVSNLFLTKTVYATILAIAIASLGWPFPFLPRHFTLLGSLTIGIPAFFLALAPNLTRYRPGFITRVFCFAIPAGGMIALTTLVSQWIFDYYAHISPAQIQTLMLSILVAAGCWIVIMLSRPLRLWVVSLVSFLVLGFIGILALPFTRRFFALDIPPVESILQALLMGTVAIFLLELIWRISYARPPR